VPAFPLVQVSVQDALLVITDTRTVEADDLVPSKSKAHEEIYMLTYRCVVAKTGKPSKLVIMGTF
jgi:hypothetical protein